MFDPEKEVPSLELCEKLKELGFPQNTGGWYWEIYESIAGKDVEVKYFDYTPEDDLSFTYVKAPTYPEIERWLPISLDCVIENSPYSAHHRLIMWKSVDGYWCGYIPHNCKFEDFKGIQVTGEDWRIKQWGETLIEACTKMVIWLRNNGYVNFNENKRATKRVW